jgi:hypothetical protein
VLEHQFARNAVKHMPRQARFVGPHQIEVTPTAANPHGLRGAAS